MSIRDSLKTCMLRMWWLLGGERNGIDVVIDVAVLARHLSLPDPTYLLIIHSRKHDNDRPILVPTHPSCARGSQVEIEQISKEFQHNDRTRYAPLRRLSKCEVLPRSDVDPLVQKAQLDLTPQRSEGQDVEAANFRWRTVALRRQRVSERGREWQVSSPLCFFGNSFISKKWDYAVPLSCCLQVEAGGFRTLS